MNIAINKKTIVFLITLGLAGLIYCICYVLVPGPDYLEHLWFVMTGEYYDYGNPRM